MRKLSLVIAAASVLVACSKPQPAPEPVRAVRTMTVSSDSAGGVHEFAAEVRARTESRLGFRVGGKLVRRAVDLGATVKAGQMLAQLDPQDLKLGQDAARAALNSAQANFDQTAADYKRFKDLRDQGFISAAELERRDTALKAAKAQLDQARAQAGVQVNQTAYATLVADAPGVITGVDADPGTVVGAGTPVLRLAHDGPRDVVFAVPEDQIAGVRALAGSPQALKVRMWGQGAEIFPATVREVAAAADPVTRTFLVKADVGKAPVRLGQTAAVLMELPKTVGVAKLPLSAVMEVQGKTAVWLVDKASMTVKPQPIQVAGAEGNSVLVSGGLAPGQTVVTAGVHVLTPGQKVKLYVDPRGGTPVAASTH
ncbi:efflux RND transporter periplasmic adaptor subunit [Ideonella sp. BN130291]|uniref:efflux RND transporter periplasmic adaptor subunit n=1 Tax=Ideonella sp. BN130291 TaxID=3112940 RepID=UPI002E265321|nr:efflux RND transporter periplasmic adaptor subunit [Ideonella sp. BN130291]